jgi:hypothetical protein
MRPDKATPGTVQIDSPYLEVFNGRAVVSTLFSESNRKIVVAACVSQIFDGAAIISSL